MEIADTSSKPSSHLESQYTESSAKAACKIQKIWRGFQSRKKNASFIKKMKYRKHIIKEIVQSEENYLTHLNLLIKNCYQPLRQHLKSNEGDSQPVISQVEFESLFANLTSIYDFNSEYFKSMKEEYKNITPYSKFCGVMLKFVGGFKIYYPYTANCEHAHKTLEALREKNKKFAEFLDQTEYTPSLNNMDLWSFLIKPVQRLTKYPLLLADLLKNTPNFHPDYQQIEDALNGYKNINEENNLHIQYYEKVMKMMEYQELYGAKLDMMIYSPDRTILMEMMAGVPKESNSEITSKIIFMTDLILVVSSTYGQKDHARIIKLDQNSIVKDLPDGKYFSNLFSITGTTAVETFYAENRQNKEKFIQVFDKAIAEIRKKIAIELLQDQGIDVKALNEEDMQKVIQEYEPKKMDVHVLGSEEHIEDGKPHTFYVILFSWGSKYHKCFKRHSDFCQFTKTLNETYPGKNILKIEKKFDLLKKFRTKTVEIRKMEIENFLQLALQDPEIKHSRLMLDFLKLPKDFFYDESPDPIIRDSRRALSTHITQITHLRGETANLLSSALGAKKGIEGLSPLGSEINRVSSFKVKSPQRKGDRTNTFHLEDKLLLSGHESERFPADSLGLSAPLLVHSPKLSNAEGLSRESFTQKYSLKVHLVDGTSFEFIIDDRTNARFICKQIARQIQLQVLDDFRLFLTEGQDRERAIDGDECMVDVLKLEGEDKKRGFLSKVSKSIMEFFREKDQQKLVFKKYFYLAKKQEQINYLSDRVRLGLLVLQILQEVKEMRYDFDYSNYLMIMCLGAYNQHHKEIAQLGAMRWFESTKKKKFYQFIPEIIFKTKPKDYWKQALQSYWKNVTEQIESKIEDNQHFIEEQKDSANPHVKEVLEMYKGITEVEVVVKHLILNLMWSQKAYGVGLYEARVYHPEDNESLRRWPTKKFMLGIKLGEILAFSMTKSRVYLTRRLKDIKKITCFPTALVLTFPDYEIRLDTKKSFEVQQLIQTYQHVEEVISGEEENLDPVPERRINI
mgnify:CR=1 FL=1